MIASLFAPKDTIFEEVSTYFSEISKNRIIDEIFM
jgi:hypothetical protein